jgi:hypothetical protein
LVRTPPFAVACARTVTLSCVFLGAGVFLYGGALLVPWPLARFLHRQSRAPSADHVYGLHLCALACPFFGHVCGEQPSLRS